MTRFPTFHFDSVSYSPEEGRIDLSYSYDADCTFTEHITIPSSSVSYDPATLVMALFALHLIGGISYYKAYCSKEIIITSGSIDEEQAQFWNAVYENGLGEFFYKNQIDYRGLIQFPGESCTVVSSRACRGAQQLCCDQDKQSRKTKNYVDIRHFDHSTQSSWSRGKLSAGLAQGDIQDKNQHDTQKVLVPIGGGKDSIVTIERLKKEGKDVTLLRMGSHPIIDACAKITGCPMITVERMLDPKLFQLNEQGAYNGHVPITAYLSFLSLVVAIIHGFDAVVFSNEKSANEGNVEYLGKKINHQWSKSTEFENLFQEYIKSSITDQVNVFSLLRSMSELEITKEFCGYPQYFNCVTSCNKNWKIVKEKLSERWCGKCPKCAFVFAQCAAFLGLDDLLKIFGKNLFEDASLLPLYKQLLGIEGFKPFECVGTAEEVKEAFNLAHKQGELEETVVMRYFAEEVPGKL